MMTSPNWKDGVVRSAALPGIVIALRVGFGLALFVIVGAEFMGAVLSRTVYAAGFGSAASGASGGRGVLRRLTLGAGWLAAAGDMANMGLQIVSFTIRDIRDSQGYLDALGKPRIAQVKRDEQIAQAEADRDAMIKSSQATQAGQEAKFVADTKIAEAERDYKTNYASYLAAVNQKRAEADLAYDLQKYKTVQLVKAEEVQVQIVEIGSKPKPEEKALSSE